MSDQIPQPFKDITDYASALRAIPTDVRDRLSDEYTHFSSIFQPTRLIDFIIAADGKHGKEVKVICAKVLQQTLRYAAPISLQMYMMGAKFVGRSRTFMVSSNTDPLAAIYDKYLPENAECNDPTEIALYNGIVSQWRKEMDNLIIPGIEALEGNVTTELCVGYQATSLAEMLGDMIRRRNSRLSTITGGANHLKETLRGFASTEHPMLSYGWLTRRKGALAGAKNIDAYNQIIDFDGPPLLLTTALLASDQKGLNLRGLIEETLAKMAERNDAEAQIVSKACTIAISEAETIGARNTGGAYRKHSASIDTVFLTHFFAFKILKLTLQDFYEWQRAIFILGGNVRGAAASRSVLNNFLYMPGVRDMINKTSKSKKIYLPPWVVNSARYQDLIATLGCCDSYTLDTIRTPAVSWRYIVNLKANRSTNIQFLVTVWALERRATEEEDPESVIYQSQHMFRQMLISKKSPFQNVCHMVGNELNVHIVE